jgi:hypothetical protein
MPKIKKGTYTILTLVNLGNLGILAHFIIFKSPPASPRVQKKLR